MLIESCSFGTFSSDGRQHRYVEEDRARSPRSIFAPPSISPGSGHDRDGWWGIASAVTQLRRAGIENSGEQRALAFYERSVSA